MPAPLAGLPARRRRLCACGRRARGRGYRPAYLPASSLRRRSSRGLGAAALRTQASRLGADEAALWPPLVAASAGRTRTASPPRTRTRAGCPGEVCWRMRGSAAAAAAAAAPFPSSPLQSSALVCQWTRRAAVPSSAWPCSRASSTSAATRQGGVPHLHGAGEVMGDGGGDRAASHICTAQVGAPAFALFLPLPLPAFPFLPSHRQALLANMAAFSFYVLYDGPEGLRAIVARGRTAAFSFPSHRQAARRLRRLWRLGPLLRHRHGSGGGRGCGARCGGGARPQDAPHA